MLECFSMSNTKERRTHYATPLDTAPPHQQQKNKEIKMSTKEFKLNSDARITSKVYAYVTNVMVDLQVYPVDVGFKLNNLSRPEFIAFANKVMNLPREIKPYASEKERTREFFHFYNLNKKLIEGETKPSYEQLRDCMVSECSSRAVNRAAPSKIM